MGHWAWGIGHGALGMGHWEWGIGNGAINYSFPASPAPLLLCPSAFLFPSNYRGSFFNHTVN
ncbi:hypothetical protein ANSO36C_60390 [Nostoc cf. commune SO-36]|uniref:Uncharacterized protein n=1 Tax=Nostoc cf. commune SO-36 TaxID=449208 RepID=A0ABN6QE55_NOSCO|nr:hypothetical protein ANSO36C_60390 [Nostoc cf. commune SO-36]